MFAEGNDGAIQFFRGQYGQGKMSAKQNIEIMVTDMKPFHQLGHASS